MGFFPENMHGFHAAAVAELCWEGLDDIVTCLVTVIPEEGILRGNQSKAHSS